MIAADETDEVRQPRMPIPRCIHGAPWKHCAKCRQTRDPGIGTRTANP
jgi:hypothetical protein